MGLRVGIIAAREVPVVGGDDGVLLPLLDVFPAGAQEGRARGVPSVLPGQQPWPALQGWGPCSSPIPLADARATGVGQDNASYVTKDLCL